ncbi:MAG: universal stress protein [Deltaproteobacteria bacterium]|nr:universal stress protein [Deltaproteobacteria bacterium]
MGRKILIAMDESENAMRGVRYAADTLKGIKDIHIILYHVLPESIDALEKMKSGDWAKALGFAEQVARIRALAAEKRRTIEEAMAKAKDILKESGIKEDSIEIKIKEREEGIARDLLKEADRTGCDTIVVGRRGISMAFFFGSVSDKIVKYAKDCTVWVVQ